MALAQLRKIDKITLTLREKKNKLKALISDTNGITYRTLNDSVGECGTLCTVIFDAAEMAAAVSKALGTTTVDHSGWDIFQNSDLTAVSPRKTSSALSLKNLHKLAACG